MKTKQTSEENKITGNQEVIDTLTTKVDSLEKQLEKCLSKSKIIPGLSLGFDETTTLKTLVNIAAAVFLPIRIHSDDDCHTQSKYSIWATLQYTLLDNPVFAQYWSNESFREAVKEINYITDNLGDSFKQDDIYHKEHIRVAREIGSGFIDGATHKTLEGMLMMRDGVIALYDVLDSTDFDGDDIDDLVISFHTIIFCMQVALESDDFTRASESK